MRGALQGFGQVRPEVAVARWLATVNVFGDAARKSQPGRSVSVELERLRQQKQFAELGRVSTADVVEQDLDQLVRHSTAILGVEATAQRQRNTQVVRHQRGRRLDARDAIV